MRLTIPACDQSLQHAAQILQTLKYGENVMSLCEPAGSAHAVSRTERRYPTKGVLRLSVNSRGASLLPRRNRARKLGATEQLAFADGRPKLQTCRPRQS